MMVNMADISLSRRTPLMLTTTTHMIGKQLKVHLATMISSTAAVSYISHLDRLGTLRGGARLWDAVQGVVLLCGVWAALLTAGWG